MKIKFMRILEKKAMKKLRIQGKKNANFPYVKNDN